jgi:Transposase DDE domain
MPTRILPILDRLRQDLAQNLSPEAIRSACRQAGYRWRHRELDPVATVLFFLLQILHGNTACEHVVHFGQWAFTASAYCKARRRLPLRVLRIVVEQVASTLRCATSTSATWLGRRVWIIDGSSFSMSDLPELQNHFGQPAGQRPGCGFPVAHWVALFDLATGMLLRVAAGPMRSHDLAKTPEAEADVAPGDVVLGDRGFCSFAHLATLLARGVDAVFRLHQKQLVDFTPGRAHAKKGDRPADSLGIPRSLWVRSNGKQDQEVVWFKPARKPKWMSAEQFAALPPEITVRELRYRVNTPGFRVREITLVTTLLDPQAYPKPELAELYRRRWQVELNFRHMKITMKMDVLRCRTVEGVMKELTMFTLAYNLIASVRIESASRQSVALDRIGFVDAIRWLTNPQPGGEVGQILVNPSRPDRVEPRVRKRRPKQFPLMKEPREVLRNRLLRKEVAA